MCWVIIILAIALTLFLVWASADVGSNVYLKSVCKGAVKDKVVTLTFDDGPDELMTPKVLDVLKRYDIKAVFFLIGEKVDKNPDIVRRIVEEGHIVANHTYSHSGLFPLSGKGKVMQELQKCGESIKNAIGRYPLLFRPPFGVTNPIIGRAVNALGLKTIGWSIRSLDTVDGKTRAEILRKVEAKLHPGAIILLHDRCAKSDELLESIIESALNRNYSFIPLDKMLKIDVYEN